MEVGNPRVVEFRMNAIILLAITTVMFSVIIHSFYIHVCYPMLYRSQHAHRFIGRCLLATVSGLFCGHLFMVVSIILRFRKQPRTAPPHPLAIGQLGEIHGDVIAGAQWHPPEVEPELNAAGEH